MLTLSMIVKNEERYLRDCLDSVEGVADEIVLVDTGSTDNTIEIAKEHKAKIFNYEWNDDFSSARNFALEQSSGDWILYMDADERLADSSKRDIKNLTMIKSKTAYYCTVKSIDEVNGRPSVMNYVRLFPNDKSIRFTGRIHEQIENSLIDQNYTLKDSSIVIEHLGYNLSNEQLKEKAARNLHLLKKEYEKNPSPYFAFQLGQTYGILNDKRNAETFFQISLNDKKLKPEYLSVANRYLSVNSAERGEWDNALEYIKKSLAADETQPVALIVAAKIYYRLNKIDEAKIYCKQAYRMNEEFSSGTRSSYQAILLDKKTILDECINISAGLNDKESFKYFYNEYRTYKNELHKNDNDLNAEFFNHLFDNISISEIDLSKYKESIKSEDQVNIIIGLLENYSHSKTKQSLFEILCDKFPSNIAALNKYARLLLKNNEFMKAEEILERLLSLNDPDPSIVFYLVSVYLNNDNNSKILPLIGSAEKRYESNLVLRQKVNLLRDKLSRFLVEI